MGVEGLIRQHHHYYLASSETVKLPKLEPLKINSFRTKHVCRLLSAHGHQFATPVPAVWGNWRGAPGGWGSGDTHSWLNMRFISSVMFMEPTSSSENRFVTSPSCSEMSSSEGTLRSFFLGTT